MTTGSDSTQGARLEWADGTVLNVSVTSESRLKLTFGDQIPPLSEIKVEGITTLGKSRAMLIPPGLDGNVAVASGSTEDVYRVRVTITKDGRADIREANLPGIAPAEMIKGPNGGSMIMIGHVGDPQSAEIVPQGDGWKIVFAIGNEPLKAPVPSEFTIQAIGPSGTEEQVRYLKVSAGPDENSLSVSGDVAGAAYARASVIDGGHWHTRCVPLA